MTLKDQKLITAMLVAAAVFGGFEALIYIVNLNQISVFLWLSLAIWLYLWIKITLLYDLHFKNPGSLSRARVKHEAVARRLLRYQKILLSALWDRLSHFRKARLFFKWANYLLLPGLIFWSTVGIFYLNLGRTSVQQIFALLSGAAIIVAFWYIKEIYTRKEERVGLDVFAALSAVKIYTALAVYGTALTLTRYYCLSPVFLAVGVFALTFLIIYQALFQHNFTQLKNTGLTAGIAGLTAALALGIYRYWGYNNLTGAVFLTAFYNLFWGLFHHSLENTLTRRVFWELIFVSLFIALMAVSVTNFRAQILPACF